MKKRIAMAMGITALLLGGCSAKEVELSSMNTDKYVTLGKYTGLEVTLASPDITDAHVDNYIMYMLSEQGELKEVTDREAQIGDTVTIDFEGKMDGKTFEGGSGQGYDLKLGSGNFIQGFEDGLVGAKTGEKRDLDLHFPESYPNAPELAGKPVVFSVTVNRIQELIIPELTDELAHTINEECNTIAELREYAYEVMYEDAVKTYERNLENSIVEQAMAGCEFKEPPKNMVDEYYDQIVQRLTAYAAMYNVDFETYITQYNGITMEDFQTSAREDASQAAKESIMLQAIANKEGIQVTKEEADGALEEAAVENGYTSVEDFRAVIGEESYQDYVMCDKVLAFLKENAVIKEPQ